MKHQMDISLHPEEYRRLRGLLEICDDEQIVNRHLLEHGLMAELAPGEFRYYPFAEEDWLCLACVAKPLTEEGGCFTSKCIIRLPEHTGENGKRFMLGFIQHMAKTEGPGYLTLGLHDSSGANN
jgi:hypothetical protein